MRWREVVAGDQPRAHSLYRVGVRLQWQRPDELDGDTSRRVGRVHRDFDQRFDSLIFRLFRSESECKFTAV